MTLIDNGLEILSAQQCRDLLEGGTVGRIAVNVGALPAIFPVNYAMLRDRIVFLTGEGTKLRAAVDRAVVAFQIDHFDEGSGSGSGWSVMAIGLAEEITEPEELRAAEQLELRPFAGGERRHFVKIKPEFVSGRRVA